MSYEPSDLPHDEPTRPDDKAARRRGHVGVLLLIVGLIVYPFLPWRAWLGLREKEAAMTPGPPPPPEIRYVEKIVTEKPPLPERSVAAESVPPDLAKLYSGLMVKTDLQKSEGDRAIIERGKEDSYTIEFKVNLRVPKPNQSLEDLSSINPNLPKILPKLEEMMSTAAVSKFYHHLYDLKTKRLQTNLTRLRDVPSRHNYYDCETILELRHPETQQRALLIQGEMDVVSDGSDGDRSPEYDDYIAKSQFYQPFTSYGWAKKTEQANPLLARWEERLAAAEKEAKEKSTAAVQNRIQTLKREIADMKTRSYLIARHDPFIVMPTSFLGYHNKTPFGPKVGDYALVIYDKSVYPAIVGDGGPTYKMGEASLRIAQAINAKASPYNRPVSDLKVTYVVFPQSADPPDAPDFDRWKKRCEELVGKLGGLGEGYSLHSWEDKFKKPAEPVSLKGEQSKPTSS